MRAAWTPSQVQEAEQRLFRTTPEPDVMRTAAYGVALHTARLLSEHAGGVAGRRVALLVGAGNNGGDALWAGAFLRRRGVGVTAVLLAAHKTHPAGLAALRKAGGRAVPADGEHPDFSGIGADANDAMQRADVVIDGIVGLSGRGSLRPVAAHLMHRNTAPVVAVDLPSGVDPLTGEVEGAAVDATLTVTFGGLKPGHVLDAGAVRSGTVEVVDIGLGPHLPEPELSIVEAADVGPNWPIPAASDDKYSQGVVGIAAGSATYPGAAVLACGSAVQATSGMVRYAGPAADVVRADWPEVVATGSVEDAGRVQAWAVGPGIGTGTSGRDVMRHVLESGRPVCADADSITLLAEDPTLWEARDPDVPLILTPHEGEFTRLVDATGTRHAGIDDRAGAVRAIATRFDAVVLLKGHTTMIASPGGELLVNVSPQAWPATAGSGDVLTGLIGALVASGVEPWSACGYAAYTHSLAAEIAATGDGEVGAPIGASALLKAIPEAIRLLRANATAAGAHGREHP